MIKIPHNLTVLGGWGLGSFLSSGRGLVVFRTFSPFNLKGSHGTQQQMLARQSQRCLRDCSGILAVTYLEGAQGLLSRIVCVYLGYITQGGAGVALAGCYEPTSQMLLFPYTRGASPWGEDE